MQRLHDAPGTERSDGRGLEDDRIAANERGRQFPGRNRAGEIPRSDETYNADGPAEGEHVHAVAFGGYRHAGHARAFACEITEDVDCAADFAFGFGEGFAFFARHFGGNFLEAAIKDIGGFEEDVAAGWCRHSRPAGQGSFGRRGGTLDTRDRALCEHADYFVSVRWITDFERLAFGAPLAINVIAVTGNARCGGCCLFHRGLTNQSWSYHKDIKANRSFDHFELAERIFLNRQAQSGHIVGEIDIAVHGPGLALENVPEKFVADFHVHDGEELGHRAVQAGHDDVEIVHLARVGHDGHRMRFRERRDFACLRDSADAVRIKLNVIDSLCVEELAKAVKRKFVLSAGNGNSAHRFQGDVAGNIVWNHGFFEPAKIVGFEKRDDAARIVQIPSHIRVGHQVDSVADHFTNSANEVQIFLYAGRTILRTPPEAQFHCGVAAVLIALCLGSQFFEALTVEAARVDGNAVFCPAAEKTKHGLLRGFSQNVPDGDIDGADGRHANSFSAEGHRLAIHQLPNKFRVERIFADQQRFQVDIDHLFRDSRRERRVTNTDQAGVCKYFDDEPAMETKSSHRVPIEIQQIHRIGAEVRLRRHTFTAPFNDSRPDFRDLHLIPLE